jgi:hypothetical protein
VNPKSVALPDSERGSGWNSMLLSSARMRQMMPYLSVCPSTTGSDSDCARDALRCRDYTPFARSAAAALPAASRTCGHSSSANQVASLEAAPWRSDTRKTAATTRRTAAASTSSARMRPMEADGAWSGWSQKVSSTTA